MQFVSVGQRESSTNSTNLTFTPPFAAASVLISTEISCVFLAETAENEPKPIKIKKLAINNFINTLLFPAPNWMPIIERTSMPFLAH
jgi:hypothetical protein